MGRWIVSVACSMALVACGGQSVDQETTGGAAGEVGSGGTGTGGGGSGNRGGSGNAAGTGNTPGGGGSSARAGSSAMGGSGGTNASEVCELPLVTGSCNAAFVRYGFYPASGRCESFIYGGCGANANNFETLSLCEASCGGPAPSPCPAKQPESGSACVELESPCYYAPNGCLCSSRGGPDVCAQIHDPACGYLERQAPPSDDPGCTGPDCPLPIVLPVPYTCECTRGAWSCVL